MMSHRILPAALLLCALAAACGENPTGSGTHAQPAGPAYDSGYGMGSGNSATQSSGDTIGSEDGEAEGSGLTGTGIEATRDDGFGVGSGNVAAGAGGWTIGSGDVGSGAFGGTTNTSTASGDTVGRSGYGMGSGN